MKFIDFIKVLVGLVVLLFLLKSCCECCNSTNTSLQYRDSYVDFWKECIEGKEFIVGHRQLSINLDFDGKPIPCEELEK